MMTKFWVDPPSGWRYGFPKIWDSDVIHDVADWLFYEGYPEPTIAFVRMWPVEEKENVDEDTCCPRCSS